MAKRITNIFVQLEFVPATGMKKIRAISYEIDDDTDTTINSYNPAGVELSPSIPRDLTATELGAGVAADGSLLTFLNDCEAAAKTAESIP